jgi:hypothetical protein
MIISKDFTPKLFSLLKDGIPAAQIRKDIVAGIIVGIVALPLAIAFAIASGVSPEKGLITAIVAGFIISIYRYCLWHHPKLWGRRPNHCHFYSWLLNPCDGITQIWNPSQVYSSPSYRGFYKWDSYHYLLLSN